MTHGTSSPPPPAGTRRATSPTEQLSRPRPTRPPCRRPPPGRMPPATLPLHRPARQPTPSAGAGAASARQGCRRRQPGPPCHRRGRSQRVAPRRGRATNLAASSRPPSRDLRPPRPLPSPRTRREHPPPGRPAGVTRRRPRPAPGREAAPLASPRTGQRRCSQPRRRPPPHPGRSWEPRRIRPGPHPPAPVRALRQQTRTRRTDASGAAEPAACCASPPRVVPR